MVGYPNFIVLNASAQTIERWSGYTRTYFLDRARDALEDPTTIEEKAVRLAKKPTPRDAASLAWHYDSKGEFTEAVKYFRLAQSLCEKPQAGYAMSTLKAVYYGFDADAFSWEDVVAAADAVFSFPTADPTELVLAARMVGGAAKADSSRRATLAGYIKAAIERSAGNTNPEVVKARTKLLPDYLLLIAKNPVKAKTALLASLPEGWEQVPDQLNRLAWWCFENKIFLAEAQAYAEKGVALSTPGGGRAMILDTLAEILNAQGKCGEALEHIQAAIADDPKNPYYRKQLVRFEKLLAEQEKY